MRVVTELSDSNIRSGLAASGAKAVGDDAAAPRPDSRLRRFFLRKPPLTLALGSVMVAATGLTMLFDNLISDLLPPHSAIFLFGEVGVLLGSALVAMIIYLLVIGRPIKQLDEAVRRLSE